MSLLDTIIVPHPYMPLVHRVTFCRACTAEGFIVSWQGHAIIIVSSFESCTQLFYQRKRTSHKNQQQNVINVPRKQSPVLQQLSATNRSFRLFTDFISFIALPYQYVVLYDVQHLYPLVTHAVIIISKWDAHPGFSRQGWRTLVREGSSSKRPHIQNMNKHT